MITSLKTFLNVCQSKSVYTCIFFHPTKAFGFTSLRSLFCWVTPPSNPQRYDGSLYVSPRMTITALSKLSFEIDTMAKNNLVCSIPYLILRLRTGRAELLNDRRYMKTSLNDKYLLAIAAFHSLLANLAV